MERKGSLPFYLPLSLEYYLSALLAQAGQEPLSQFLAQECHSLCTLWDRGPWKFLKSVLGVEEVEGWSGPSSPPG